jgi:periplasmic protein TonB
MNDGKNTPVAHQKTFYATLTDDTKPATMLIWFMVLALALHIKSMLWLAQPRALAKPAAPLPITVTLLPVPIKKAKVEPVVKPKPIEKPKKKPPPPKLKPKPIPKPKPVPAVKPKPALQTAPMAKTVDPQPKAAEPIITPAPIVQTPAPVHQPSANTQANTQAKTSAQSSRHNLEANDVNGKCTPESIHTPQPPYPQSAINRHLEGTVIVEFIITAQGLTEQVNVSKSSGYEILDNAAIKAVQKWKYATTRPCQANKPIKFNLR